jgi:hypothetical protein
MEGRIEVTGRRRTRRRESLRNNPKEKGGYWKLKEEALDRTLWKTRFEREYGPDVRQSALAAGYIFRDTLGVISRMFHKVNR